MTRVALVTGGTRGIGGAISQALKNDGCRVAANYHASDEAAERFRSVTGIDVYKWDVSDFAACEAGVAQVEQDLGPIDILVNNAGITRDGTLQRMTPDNWQAVLDTNLGSCFNLCHATFPGMRARKFGRVVNIGSINGPGRPVPARSTTPRRSPASTASPRRWRRRARATASP